MRRSWRGTLVVGAVLATGLAGACARQGMPPGGPEDRRPPVVVRTVPDTFALLTEPFRGPVRFEFDERISERVASGSLAQAVVVSPRSGEVRVRHGRQGIEVTMEGGFRPGMVYRVTLLPVLQDLFNNRLLAPFELVFSTGGDYNPSAVAGTVFDRVTGEGVDGLEVQAISATGPDSIPHVAKTDTAGVYVFRYLPPGSYSLVAFQDRNRNGVVDRMELQGMGAFQVAGADTSFIDVSVLQPDTTPARLTRAVVVDSLTVLLEFDDNLEPESRSDLFGVSFTADETGEPVRVDVFHERDYVRWRDQLQDSFARLDSLEAARRAEDALEDIPLSGDTLSRDSAAAPTAGPGAPGPAVRARPVPPALPRATGGGRPQGDARAATGDALTPDGRPIPSRRLVLRLADFLVVNAGYKVVADNVVNINGVPGGGGESAVVREPPPADSTAVTDTTATPDSAAVAPSPVDSAQVRDTIPPPRDTIPAGGQAFLPGRRR